MAFDYRGGDGVAKDPTKAVDLLQRAVDAGVDDALLPLGFAYLGAMVSTRTSTRRRPCSSRQRMPRSREPAAR